MACPRRSSRPGWSPACSRSWGASGPSGGSRSGSTTTSPSTSLSYDPSLDIEPPETVRAVFFGLGSDGTVGANKNTIKILGSEESLHAQGYFVYDSKKSGSQTVSHLRFGPEPIRAPYLISQASFVGCHHFGLLERAEVLDRAAPGATLLLNCRHAAGPRLGRARASGAGADPRQADRAVRDRRGRRSRAMRASPGGPTRCFRRASSRSRACSSASEAIERIKASIAKTYGKRGAEVVERNQTAVDRALEHLHRVELPEQVTSDARAGADRSRARAGVRAHRDRRDDGRPRRSAAGQRAAGGRHLPERHDAV